MKNLDYVLRLESPLSGETNSYSSFYILHLTIALTRLCDRKRRRYLASPYRGKRKGLDNVADSGNIRW